MPFCLKWETPLYCRVDKYLISLIDYAYFLTGVFDLGSSGPHKIEFTMRSHCTEKFSLNARRINENISVAPIKNQSRVGSSTITHYQPTYPVSPSPPFSWVLPNKERKRGEALEKGSYDSIEG